MSRVAHIGCLCAVSAAFALSAHAQYPGHVDTNQQPTGTHLRATAVLEYTGDLPKPKATRLIPIAVWDGTNYQPGGLYLAQPAPLAVLSGTQYELLSDGKSKGLFNVTEAEDLGGTWIGVGSYKAPAPPAPKRRSSKHMPRVVQDYDPDKPHFAHRPADEAGGDQSGSNPAANSAPPVDPDRPTLHSRTGGSSSDAGSSNDSAAKQPDVDPDRPTFHRHPAASDTAPSTAASASVQPAVDPDRPLLHYGAPTEQEKLDQPDALTGVPQDMKQMAGISDTRPLSGDTYAYSWSNPDDAAKMKAALETIAEQALAPPPKAVTKPSPRSTATHTTHRKAAAAPEAPKLPVLADEDFQVYGLTFGGGATMVLSARTASDPVKYVTIVAQPDFYGQPQVLLKQVTTEAEMDVIPRMRLVDAVDTEGNGRADLIFEMRGRTYRQFAIYRIAGGTATQAFITQPTALQPSPL